MIRRTLPQRRASETFDLRFWNQNFTVSIGRYPDGTPGEVFIDGGKTGQDVQSTARDAAVVLSLALQHGILIEVIRHVVTRSGSGEAASILGGDRRHAAGNCPRRGMSTGNPNMIRITFRRACDRSGNRLRGRFVAIFGEQQVCVSANPFQAAASGLIYAGNALALAGRLGEANFDAMSSTIGEAAKWTFEGYPVWCRSGARL
jgi:hypothetical protein